MRQIHLSAASQTALLWILDNRVNLTEAKLRELLGELMANERRAMGEEIIKGLPDAAQYHLSPIHDRSLMNLDRVRLIIKQKAGLE